MKVLSRSALSRDVAEFLRSMPPAYAQSFSARDIAEHAEIVSRRGELSAHAEPWRGRSSASSYVCVVAEDRPGLLSFVTDALLLHALNIQSAQIYCRLREDGTWEAIDFFCVEPACASGEVATVEPSELMSFAQTLRELIAEEQVVERKASERDTIPVPRPRPSRVYFDVDALKRNELCLVVDTPNFSGLLFCISSALHGQNARIMSSQIRTQDGVAHDRFQLAFCDDQPITSERLCDAQQAVWSALRAGSKGQ
jgi:UTP:GlnB (protein PII) uridylyltransferase